jgi:hypothetical protein
VISREDFIFTIGYEGEQAIVDGKAKAKYGSFDTMALAREGLLRAAFASALYGGDPAELTAFAELYNQKAGTKLSTADDFSRLFGIKREEIKKVLIL